MFHFCCMTFAIALPQCLWQHITLPDGASLCITLFSFLLLRQQLISCLLNTWRQSQQGNYWGHSRVCTQPSLTHCTSFRAQKRPCCFKGSGRESSVDWWSTLDMSNKEQQMSLELIKPGICHCFFIMIRTWSSARVKNEEGLSPILIHEGTGIREMVTHMHAHANSVYWLWPCKNRKIFWRKRLNMHLHRCCPTQRTAWSPQPQCEWPFQVK